MIIFSDWLKEEMKQQNISQFELATKIGAEQSNVCKWVHGQNAPSFKNIQKVLDALGYHIEFIRNECE